MANQAVQSSSVDQVTVPLGPITSVRAKRLKESFQALMRAIQEQIGVPKSIERLDRGNSSFVTLIQVE